MTRAYSVLLLGPSGIMLRDGGAMADMLANSLRQHHAEAAWSSEPELLYISEGMARRAVDAVERHKPDAIALLLGSPAFGEDFVVLRIRRRIPQLYRPALWLSNIVRTAAGGGAEGDDGTRGLIFRLPQRLARRTIGADPSIDLNSAIRCATETVDALLRLERFPVVCRVGFSVSFFRDRKEEHQRRLREFNDAVSEHCESKRVPWYDLDAEMARFGLRTSSVGDGVHPDQKTREFDMGVMAGRIASTLLT